MHSTNIALRSASRLPNTSASDINPPGLTVEQMQEVAKMGAYVESNGA